jgi:Flp pilus assembly protein TadG
MRRSTTRTRGGNSLIEFTLLGIPVMFITISIVAVSVGMWEFQSLEYATQTTTRYISMHGASCAQNGNSCTITVGNIAAYFAAQELPLDTTILSVTLTDAGGTPVSCSPVSTCTSSSTQFPGASHNSVGSNVTVSATYVLKNPIALFWPPDHDSSHDFTVGATSTQRIVF